ncbi:MAG: dUTP pyrophosphatase [Myxococcota bacterium]
MKDDSQRGVYVNRDVAPTANDSNASSASTSKRTADEQSSAVRVLIVRLPHGEGLAAPKVATPGSAGADLAAAVVSELTLAPGQREAVPTGFSIAIPLGFEGQVRARSGLALRNGIVVPNAPGTIDADYRGELKVLLMNAGSEPFVIKRGDRIAQLVIAPVVQALFDEVESLDETERGEGGFGHTGRKS